MMTTKDRSPGAEMTLSEYVDKLPTPEKRRALLLTSPLGCQEIPVSGLPLRFPGGGGGIPSHTASPLAQASANVAQSVPAGKTSKNRIARWRAADIFNTGPATPGHTVAVTIIRA